MKSQAKYALLPSYDDVAHSTDAKMPAKWPRMTDGFTRLGALLADFLWSLLSLPSRLMLCFTAFGIYQVVRVSKIGGSLLVVVSLFGCDRDVQARPPIYAAFLIIAINICVLAILPPTWSPLPWESIASILGCEVTLIAALLFREHQKLRLEQEPAASRAALAAIQGVATDSGTELTPIPQFPAVANADSTAEQIGDLLSEEEEQQQVESSIGGGAIDR